MREQVITPRGRAAAGAKGRKGGAAGQRPASRRARPAKPARAKGLAWKRVLALVPLMLKLLLAVSFGVLAFVGYRTAASASFFKVRAVDVEGAQRASREEIKQTVLKHAASSGVWRADLEAISGDVRELPWVRSAVVTRVLPDGLRVRVTERAPAVIARTAQGKLVWVDDDGVMLGAASPGEREFFVRGLEEARTAESKRHNRERVAAAAELAREWERTGLSRRVSEVNLDDLRDVRVQLAGDDAHIEVRLGKEDFARRFRQALEVLDAQRSTPRGPFVTYVDVSQGKRAIVGTGATAHVRPVEASDAAAQPAQQNDDAGGDAPTPAPAAAPKAAKKEVKKSKPREKEQGRRGNAVRQPEVATRPRRAG